MLRVASYGNYGDKIDHKLIIENLTDNKVMPILGGDLFFDYDSFVTKAYQYAVIGDRFRSLCDVGDLQSIWVMDFFNIKHIETSSQKESQEALKQYQESKGVSIRIEEQEAESFVDILNVVNALSIVFNRELFSELCPTQVDYIVAYARQDTDEDFILNQHMTRLAIIESTLDYKVNVYALDYYKVEGIENDCE